MLQRFPQCQVVRILQGFYGGHTPKPTRLLFINAPHDVEDQLFYCRTTPLPKKSAVGKEASGVWATAKLKEYPGGLCHAFGTIFQQAIPRKGLQPLPEEFTQFVRELVAEFDEQAEQGKDYNPATILCK